MSPIAVIDHLVYFVPDLTSGQDWFERELGVRPTFGGQHLGLGTHNALVSMGDSYIELIAADPEQPEPSGPRPFGLDDLEDPTLVTFAVRPMPGCALNQLLDASTAAGHDPGTALAMSRRRPDGIELNWTLTFPTGRAGGAVPFFIDWGETPNPATSAPGGLELVSLAADPTSLSTAGPILEALGLVADASSGGPGVQAQVASATGTAFLR